jgi:hypothetical protein
LYFCTITERNDEMYSHLHYHLSKHLEGVEHLSFLFLSAKNFNRKAIMVFSMEQMDCRF